VRFAVTARLLPSWPATHSSAPSSADGRATIRTVEAMEAFDDHPC
jgi:hypothetical protein